MKPIKGIIITILFGSLSVLSLAIISGLFKPTPKNGFSRKYIDGILERKVVPKPKNLLGYIGRRMDSLYFSTKKADEIYVCDTSLSNFSIIKFRIPLSAKWQGNFKHFISGDSLFSWAANVPALYSININQPNTLGETKLPHNFTRGIRLSQTTFLLRSFDMPNTMNDQVFLRFNSKTGESLKNASITQKFNDWGMLTDGLLCFDSISKTISYTHLFSNEIIWLDSNLTILRRTRTIDTSFAPKGSTKVFTAKGGKKATFNAPPEIVNLYSQISSGLLFIYSAKKSDNESVRHGSNLDLYSTKNGGYISTLKVPSTNEDMMLTFNLEGDLLIAIYKNQVALFELHLPNSARN